VPFAADKRFYQKYRDAGLDDTEAMYAALVEGMDKSLGDLMANLDRHSIASNTVVLFMSDNGGLSVHGRGGTPNTHNAPLSSGKGSAREGGVRVPMIVKWPGVTAPGSVCKHYVMIEDFLPSILDMTGASAKAKKLPRVDGVSFTPLLRGGSKAARYPKGRALYWHYPNVWGPNGPGIGPHSAIRRGDWKLIYYHTARRCELFNLATDLGEQHDLVETERAKAKELAASLTRWLKETKSQMPTDKQTGKPVELLAL